ncbi:hypothetical protein BH11PSE4_BH11PSE4_38290 [soil metagenome]
MNENVQTAMFEILKKVQGDLAAFRAETEQRFQRVDDRFERIEDVLRKHRRDYAAMLVMAHGVVGDFDERVTKIENRVTALEARTT